MWRPETRDPSILKYVYDIEAYDLVKDAENGMKNCTEAIAANNERLKEIPAENKRLGEAITRLADYIGKVEARKAEVKLTEKDIVRYALVVKTDFMGAGYRFEPWVVVKASVPGKTIKQKSRSDIITGPPKLPETAEEVYSLRTYGSGYGAYLDRAHLDTKGGFKVYYYKQHKNCKTLAFQDAIKYIGDKSRVLYLEDTHF